jgi:hypothetical protein
MTVEEVLTLARELHFIVDYDVTGQMILMTGVVDETKQELDIQTAVEEDDDGDEYFSDDLDDWEEEEDVVYDPIEDHDWDPGEDD